MEEYVFHNLVTDKRLTEEILGDIALKGITEPGEILRAYRERICFEYVKVLGSFEMHMTIDDLPFSGVGK